MEIHAFDCDLLKFRFGSISEQITLDTLGSGDERKAEVICRLISGVFSSQFGQWTKPLARESIARISTHLYSQHGPTCVEVVVTTPQPTTQEIDP